jgi:hypothetical protein
MANDSYLCNLKLYLQSYETGSVTEVVVKIREKSLHF